MTPTAPLANNALPPRLAPIEDALDLSIVMVNWNTLELTSAALGSLREWTQGVTYEVILVDNGTVADDSPWELPRRFPWARFIANDRNLGFTRANNQGLALARGRHVLLLNSDTLLTENAVGRAVDYLDLHPEVGALGVLHRNMDDRLSPQPSAYSFPAPWGESLRLLGLPVRRDGAVAAGVTPVALDVDWVCGSFLMIRRRCLEEVGLLDERFFSYDEDIDWCRRARQRGWKVRFWSGASILHLGSAASPFLADKRLQMFRSRLAYLRKHHSAAAAAVFYLAATLRFAGAALKHALRLLIGRSTAEDLRERSRRFWRFLTLAL